MSVRRQVYLHGVLADPLIPGPIEVVGATVAEVLRILSPQIKRLRGARVKVVGYDSIEALVTPDDRTEIHVVPQLCGGKAGGFLQIVLGAVMVAAAIAISVAIPGASAALISAIGSLGASLVIGGILQLLNQPKNKFENNHYLGVPENTTAIGTTIPILMGRRRVGGQFLSSIIEATEVGLYNYQGAQD